MPLYDLLTSFSRLVEKKVLKKGDFQKFANTYFQKALSKNDIHIDLADVKDFMRALNRKVEDALKKPT